MTYHRFYANISLGAEKLANKFARAVNNYCFNKVQKHYRKLEEKQDKLMKEYY